MAPTWRDGLPLEEYWADGPSTFLGIMAHGFPNFFFPGGPHGAAGNNPRYAGDQSDFVANALDYMREHGYRVIEVPAGLEGEWTTTINTEAATRSSFVESSYFYGANVPGEARRFLLNPLGRPRLLELMEEVDKGRLIRFEAGGRRERKQVMAAPRTRQGTEQLGPVGRRRRDRDAELRDAG